MHSKERVVVAMSGGVDSSVVAAMLVEEGYDVVGITIKTYNYEEVGGNSGNETSCCSLDGINDARRVAQQLGFPHYVLDFSEVFGATVVDDFVEEYLNGRTPNPCVVCNRKIKWEELLRKADALGADRIATGHYAGVRCDERTGRYLVRRGKDRAKDQSYALWGLTQASLARTLFPLADLTKQEARARAVKYGLGNAQKGDSFEICFIPDNDYGRFLRERIPDLPARVEGGEMQMNGNVVGRHRGYPFYTIGQRRGLGLATGEPLYVTSIDRVNNRLEIGTEAALLHRGLIATRVNLMKYASCPEPLRVDARIRYKDGGGGATMTMPDDESLNVVFDGERRAVTPGQSVVLYEGDDIVAGGVIERVTG